MFKQHFTKANLVELPSCFLDPQGNFIMGGSELKPDFSIGVHVYLAEDIICEHFGFADESDEYYAWVDKNGYPVDCVESLGYIKFSHWPNQHKGLFCLSSETKPTHAQKLAIREFCRVNGQTWDTLVFK